MNKSILLSAIIGLPTEKIPPLENPVINITIPKVPEKPLKKLDIIELPKPKPVKDQLLIVITLPDILVEKIIIPELIKALLKSKNCSSILDSVDSGFGPEQTVTIPDCPKPQYYTYLYKENYLGEFKTEEDKLLARDNLGVYSKTYIDKILSELIQNNDNFATKDYVNSAIEALDFVDSIIKAYADYQIPENLFKI